MIAMIRHDGRRLLQALLTVLVLAALIPALAIAPAHAAPPTAETKTVHTQLGSGARHMQSTVTWYPAANGAPDRLVGSTRTWTDVKMTGFTGQVVVLFVNERGQTVGYSPIVQPLGVDGRWIGRWSRTDQWQLPIAPDQTAGAVSFEIVHSRGHVDRTQAQVAAAKAWLEPALTVIKILGW